MKRKLLCDSELIFDNSNHYIRVYKEFVNYSTGSCDLYADLHDYFPTNFEKFLFEFFENSQYSSYTVSYLKSLFRKHSKKVIETVNHYEI